MLCLSNISNKGHAPTALGKKSSLSQDSNSVVLIHTLSLTPYLVPGISSLVQAYFTFWHQKNSWRYVTLAQQHSHAQATTVFWPLHPGDW